MRTSKLVAFCLAIAGLSACGPVDTGAGPVNPDGGPVFVAADGGVTPTGGAPDAGADAGSGGGGGGGFPDAGVIPPDAGGAGAPDAGTTPPPDAGASDGGALTGCQGVLPADAPAPRSAVVPHNPGDACFYFTADRAGDVAAESHSGPEPIDAHWQIWTPDGTPAGTLRASSELQGQQSGFVGLVRDSGAGSVVHFSSTGAELGRTLLGGPGCQTDVSLSVVPGVLGVAGCSDSTRASVFDSSGNLVATTTLAAGTVAATGLVDALGHTVVVASPGSAFGLSTKYAARWYDAALAPLTGWFELPGSGNGPYLRPLIGGGAAFQVESAWIAVLSSGATGYSPPPAWLSSHPKYEFQIIRGGRAYALMAKAGAAGPRDVLELRSAAGELCGTGKFPAAALVVGIDGTVIGIDQSGSGGPYCNLRWYSGLLR